MKLSESIKRQFHRDLVSRPECHGWVLNLYRSGERYPKRVTDYFQSDFAPTPELACRLRRHAAEEDKHVGFFEKSLGLINQPVVELEAGDVFNEVIRSFTPGTFQIREADSPEVRRRKLANFLAHAHHLERRVAQSFVYHIEACHAVGAESIAEIVGRAKIDEDSHVEYTREAVFDLLTRQEAQSVMEVHRRAEARANLIFSQRQVRAFLANYGVHTPKVRQQMYRFCAAIMEMAGTYA